MPTPRWVAGAPPEARPLAVLAVAAAGACGFSAAFPLAPGRPVALLVGLMITGVLLAIVLAVAGPRVSQGMLVATVALVVVMTSVLVGASSTTGGAMLAGYAYVWI